MNASHVRIQCANAVGLLLAALLLPLSAGAQQGKADSDALPIFDAHVHYSKPAWSAFPPAVVERKLAVAGVLRGLVSSSPDDGTLSLYRQNPTLFVPELRPYREGVGSASWAGNDATVGYLRDRLPGAPYVGIGEFHLFDTASAGTAVVKAVAKLALDNGLLLHIHADAEPVQAVREHTPGVRILWAHAGMVTSVHTVRSMLERYDDLWADLSFREHTILRGGRLDADWRALLVDHAGRFLVGSDTYVNGRWEQYDEIIANHRRYLAELPQNVAHAIAYGNAVRLFGGGGAGFPTTPPAQ